jgi:hypothetical protein
MSTPFVPVGAPQNKLLAARRHSIDQQVCRWLLMSLDRIVSDELTLT